MEKPKTSHYEELFINENGKEVWLTTWSEKFQELKNYFY